MKTHSETAPVVKAVLHAGVLAAEEFHRDGPARPRNDTQPKSTQLRIAAFEAWIERWRSATGNERLALGAEGIAFAAERRMALKELISIDPAQALQLVVPIGLRVSLPIEVQSQLETRIDARGDLRVAAICTGPVHRTFRWHDGHRLGRGLRGAMKLSCADRAMDQSPHS